MRFGIYNTRGSNNEVLTKPPININITKVLKVNNDNGIFCHQNKVEAAEITQIDIDNTRAQYIPVANRGQLLYFCLADLANVDPMYQYSLDWYINIFVNSMATTEKSGEYK